MEIGSQYCSKRSTPARHQNDHQAPTVSSSIGDKTRTRYFKNGASKYFCRGAFTVISKWRNWMKDRCNSIAVWGEKNPPHQPKPPHVVIHQNSNQRFILDKNWKGVGRKLKQEGCTPFPFLKVMPNWSYQNLKKTLGIWRKHSNKQKILPQS